MDAPRSEATSGSRPMIANSPVPMPKPPSPSASSAHADECRGASSRAAAPGSVSLTVPSADRLGRSQRRDVGGRACLVDLHAIHARSFPSLERESAQLEQGADLAHRPGEHLLRSEEHTSELQSQSNLVCRLLLEKKKNNR